MAAMAWILLTLVTGAAVYCAVVVLAARDYLAQPKPALLHPVPISVLKPLAGLDEGLEENLRSYFRQDYPNFELLFATRDAGDPAVAVVEKLRAEFPSVPVRLVTTGESPWANHKCYFLDRMLAQTRHELIVMSDSDTRVGPDLLATLAAEFEDPGLGLASCPYRAIGGRDIWSRLEATGMNTEMLAGILADRVLEGVKFGLGPVMAARRKAIEVAGGFVHFKDYLTEDFLIGQRIAERSFGTILSSYVIEHRLGTQTWRASLAHRLRWLRGGRRMRPAGYIGQLFTYPLPLALALWAVRPASWPAVVAALTMRLVAAWVMGIVVLRARFVLRRLWYLPVQDILGFVLWIAGFFGNTVSWRGLRYVVNRDGTFRAAGERPGGGAA